MPIRQRTGQGESITESSRAMRLFTDRHDAIKHFAALLNDDLAADQPTPEKVLFFHGDGGNGKSLLLRFLRERCCKRLSIAGWQYISVLDGEEFVAHLTDAEEATEVPTAAIDFGSGPALAEGSIQDVPVALLQLRRDLTEQGFRFPIFDFACIWYLHKARNLSGEQIKSYFPAQDLTGSVVDAFTGTSWGSIAKAAMGLLGKNLDKRFTIFSHQRKLEPEQLERIQSLDPRTELIDHLPEFFAEDLNAAMRAAGAPKRVALFFDTHEAFWGARDRELANDRFFYRDEWLRGLLTALDLTAGIVVVVAGRETPLWKQASRFVVPEEYLNLWLVKHLTRHDAAIYLERAGVADEAMQQALIDYASVAVDEVHPLYLGMCVDIVRAAIAGNILIGPEAFHDAPQMETKEAELLDRLLRYVDQNIGYAVRALSACRAFNLEIYLRLGRELNFAASEPSFQVLRNFSFVWESKERREGWHRIHDLVRRLGRDNEDDVVRRADEVMEKYYRELAQAGDEEAIAEAIYHANQLDWQRGVVEWEKVFDSALEMSRYKLCDALLDVRSEMSIKSDFHLGGVSQSEGDYFLSLARYDTARREYLEAIAAYDKALTLAPDDVEVHNNKGNALQRLGDLQAELSQHDEAVKSWQAALAEAYRVLKIAPNDKRAKALRDAMQSRLAD